jgi:hypothetical protein
MSPTTKKILIGLGLYLSAGVGTAAHSAWLWSVNRPHFEGLGNAGAALGLAETVLLWPYALAVNVTGKGG